MNWVVGDIHGCVRTLEKLLREIRPQRGRDTLWTVGDLVNRGPSSPEAVRLWRDAGGRGVLGNHDIYALAVHAGTAPRRRDNLDALLEASDSDELFDFLRAMPLLARLAGAAGAPEAWLVHAGLHPDWDDPPAILRADALPPLDDAVLHGPEAAYATRVRCVREDGVRLGHTGRPEDCPPPGLPWDALYRGAALVVHGHWASRGHYRGARTLGLDSGCVYGGALTAWCMEEDRVVQVECEDER